MSIIGEQLKKERKRKNISLSELAKKTSINERYLKALEEEDYDVLPPGEIYKKGYIRLYIKSLGIDKELNNN